MLWVPLFRIAQFVKICFIFSRYMAQVIQDTGGVWYFLDGHSHSMWRTFSLQSVCVYLHCLENGPIFIKIIFAIIVSRRQGWRPKIKWCLLLFNNSVWYWLCPEYNRRHAKCKKERTYYMSCRIADRVIM